MLLFRLEDGLIREALAAGVDGLILVDLANGRVVSGIQYDAAGVPSIVFGLFGLVVVNLQRTIDAVAERVEIVAYLRRGTAIEAVTTSL